MLARELCKQCEIYKKLLKQFNEQQSIYTNLNDYLAKLNDYVQNDHNLPLIIYDQNDVNNYNDNDLLSKIISKWIKNQQPQHNNNNQSIIYRFCGHTVFSNSLYNVFQSIVHQLCYLFEVHESYSYHVSLFFCF